jgi:hypothetical protein
VDIENFTSDIPQNKLCYGSLSNITLEAISPGKGGNSSSLSSSKMSKKSKPPKPQPPKQTLSKNSLIPPRSYNQGETQKKEPYKQTLFRNSNKSEFQKRGSSAESDSEGTKQSIYISEMNGRVKAMQKVADYTS